MKVLLVVPYLAPVYGGPAKSVRELAEGISQAGINVDVITTNANGLSKLEVPLNVWVQEKHYRIRYFSCWHQDDFIISFPLARWLLQHGQQYDIINTHTIFSTVILPVLWICQWRRIPYVVHPHGMLETWALAYKAWKKRPYYWLFERPGLQQASLVRVLSATEANNVKFLKLKTQPPLLIVPNAIHHHEFEQLPSPTLFHQQFPQTQGKTLILFLGRIDPKKGLDLLAPAFAQAQARFPQTHLIVAGPDTIGFLPKARSFFAQAGCLEAVTFTGMLTGPLKLAALAAASIYVAPTYSEGFSMSVLEGMASGLPCVITTGCNFPEAAAAEAAHVVAIDAEAIAAALITCLENPAAAEKMGDRARQFIFENHTWKQAATRLIKAFETITQTAGP